MEKIKVILCEAGKCAEVVEIDDCLKAFQDIVGGFIEEYMPFDDDVCIVCNDEGKMHNLPLNRAITDEQDKIIDVICGNFFICYAPIESDRFLSLPMELEEKYKEKFYWPEQIFLKNERCYTAIKYSPDYRAQEVRR